MESWVAELEPKRLFEHFARLLRVPRPSGKEEAAREYVREVAARRGLPVRQDAAGNLVVEVPAARGWEHAPWVALQAHLDMVCEKDSGTDFDFNRESIRPVRDGGWLRAQGTTLGADNGIGVSAMLAIATDPEAVHGPLELLFTVEEETGLLGALRLDPSILRARTLLNLDSEEEGAIYIGCAGGAGTFGEVPLDRMYGAEGLRSWVVAVKGLAGGHSGLDIHLGRGNAISLLARILWTTLEEHQFEVVDFQGGNLHNAIPREAWVRIRVAPGDEEALFEEIRAEESAIRTELAGVDDGFRIEIREEPALPDEQVWTEETTWRVLSLLFGLPHGVLAMSRDLPGLVETSTNLAKVQVEEDEQLEIHQSSRSSLESSLRATQRRVEALIQLAGGVAVSSEGYPGWKPDLKSLLLARLQEAYRELFGREAELKAVHAGLECGVLKSRVVGLDCASIGPRIEYPHSPREGVEIASVERFYRFLTASLQRLAQG